MKKTFFLFALLALFGFGCAASNQPAVTQPIINPPAQVDTNQPTPINKQPTNETEQTKKPQTFAVEAVNFAFSPTTIEVNVGDTVVWTNRDSVGHLILADGAEPLFKSTLLLQGQTFRYTFTTPGTYTYICQPHPRMVGTITVK
jgi:plastocyanin